MEILFNKLSLSIVMQILFNSRRKRLGLGEVGHMGGHIGVVLSMNIKAHTCNPIPLPPTDRWWSRSVTAILAPLPSVILLLYKLFSSLL